jgi:uncharacterized tellurite resistance protein B-like protein
MSLWKMLGLSDAEAVKKSSLGETETVRKIVRALEQLPPEKARYVAAFSYVLSRVAHSDQKISLEETRIMEEIIMRVGQLSEEQAIIAVQMAKTQSLLLGGIEDYVVTREFNRIATLEEKTALLHCLYAVAEASGSISAVEDNEIRQIADELKFSHSEFIDIRLQHKEHLEVLKNL